MMDDFANINSLGSFESLRFFIEKEIRETRRGFHAVLVPPR